MFYYIFPCNYSSFYHSCYCYKSYSLAQVVSELHCNLVDRHVNSFVIFLGFTMKVIIYTIVHVAACLNTLSFSLILMSQLISSYVFCMILAK